MAFIYSAYRYRTPRLLSFAKGFGFTLRGECDFKLEDFWAPGASPEFFEPFYGTWIRVARFTLSEILLKCYNRVPELSYHVSINYSDYVAVMYSVQHNRYPFDLSFTSFRT